MDELRSGAVLPASSQPRATLSPWPSVEGGTVAASSQGGRRCAEGQGLHLRGGLTHAVASLTPLLCRLSPACVFTYTYRRHRAPSHPQARHPCLLRRFLLQLVGILLEDIVTKQLRVDMSEQQHTFYCQELGTLLMCLIHIFKSGGCLPCPRLRERVPSRPHWAQATGEASSAGRGMLSCLSKGG